MNAPEDVLDFWFGPLRPAEAPEAGRFALWFGKNPETDRAIRERFEADVLLASEGRRDSWAATPRGTLALVVLLDQFPRNLWRGAPRAFAFDARALALSLAAQARGDDRALHPAERGFLYLPMEHAESLEMQERSVRAFARLAAEAPPALRELTESFRDYAVRHRDAIARFGRFPHRNAILGRPSTPEEIAFLREPGSSF